MSEANLEKIRLDTKLLEEELYNGESLIYSSENFDRKLKEAISSEVEKQNILRQKIVQLKKRYQQLQYSISKSKDHLKALKTKTQNYQLTKDHHELLIKKLPIKSLMVKNNLLELEAKISTLSSEIKERETLYLVLKSLIQTAQANDFQGVTWKVKLASSDKGIGARLCLENLSFVDKDLKELFLPLIMTFNESFRDSKISFETYSKRDKAIIFSLDFKIKLTYSEKTTILELP